MPATKGKKNVNSAWHVKSGRLFLPKPSAEQKCVCGPLRGLAERVPVWKRLVCITKARCSFSGRSYFSGSIPEQTIENRYPAKVLKPSLP
jgi:hypothetical protein